MGIQVQPNKAVVGDNAFSHEDEIHTDAVLDNPMTYESISPELVGGENTRSMLENTPESTDLMQFWTTMASDRQRGSQGGS